MASQPYNVDVLLEEEFKAVTETYLNSTDDNSIESETCELDNSSVDESHNMEAENWNDFSIEF